MSNAVCTSICQLTTFKGKVYRYTTCTFPCRKIILLFTTKFVDAVVCAQLYLLLV